MSNGPRIAIVGAGISGLTTAYELQTRLPPARLWLFDADDHPGGKVRTLRTRDFFVELGPDAIVTFKPAGLALVRELGLHDTATTPAPEPAYISWGSRLHRLSPGLFAGPSMDWRSIVSTGLLSPWGRLRVLMDAVIPPRRSQADESVGSFFRRRFGVEFRDRIADPLLAGLHSADVDTLSMAALFPQVREMEQRHGSLIRGLRKLPKRESLGPPFRSLTGGLETLTEALTRRLSGQQVLLGTRVHEVSRAPASWLVRATDRTYEADAVVLAMPAPAAAPLVRGLAPALADELQRQAMTSVAVAVYAWRGPAQTPGTGFLVPGKAGTLITGATFSSVKWPGSAQPGWVVARAYLGRAGRQDWWDRDDDHLLDAAWKETAAIAKLVAEPSFRHLRRWPAALPQYTVGHLDWLARVEAEAARHTGLFLTGASYRGIGLADLIQQARETAGKVATMFAPTTPIGGLVRKDVRQFPLNQ